MRLLVCRRSDFLRELIDLCNHVRNLAQGLIQLVAQLKALVHDVGALVHVLDGFACLSLDTLD